MVAAALAVDSEAVLAEAAETPAAVGDLAASAAGVLAAVEQVGIGERNWGLRD